MTDNETCPVCGSEFPPGDLCPNAPHDLPPPPNPDTRPCPFCGSPIGSEAFQPGFDGRCAECGHPINAPRKPLLCPICKLMGNEARLEIKNDHSFLYDTKQPYPPAIYLKCPMCKSDITLAKSIYDEL